jgi:hypothetical protein
MSNRKASAANAPLPVSEPVSDFRTIQVIFKMASRGELQTPSATVRNFICTDQSPVSALASLTGYFQQSELLTTPKTLELVTSAGQKEDFAFFYYSPDGLQVVMEMNTWAGLCEMCGGSMMAASDFLNVQGVQLLAALDPEAPFVAIHRLDFSFEAPVVEEA